MTAPERVVVVGAGQCAAAAAAALRSAGFEGPVVLVGEEPMLPYERPPLSKDYLAGTADASVLTIRTADWYDDHDVEVLTGARVSGVRPGPQVVELSDGRELRCDRLLFATGARPAHLPGVEGERVRHLRTRGDADRLTPHLGPGRRVVIIGAGFIGCEVAAVARARGADVTIVEVLDTPLGGALDADLGQAVAAIHRDHGVDLRTGTRVESVTETADGMIVTTDGGRLECDLVLVAVGVVPNVEVARDAGLTVDDGIVVDEYCETSIPGIFAAGDVARHFHPLFGRSLRVEHHDNAVRQGAAAARNMLGLRTVYDDAHWFWSDQYDHSLQSVGLLRDADEVVDRGDLDQRAVTRFHLREGRLQGLVALDRPRDVLRGRKLVQAGVRADPAVLADPDTDLRTLLPRPDRRAAGTG